MLRAQTVSAGLTAAAVAAGWWFQSAGVVGGALGAFTLAYLAGGWDATRRSLGALRQGDVDVDLLMVLAAVGAASVGHWLEGAVLLFLFTTGNALQAYAFGRTRRSIEALMSLRPEEANVLLEGGGERTAPVADLVLGDVVRVRPGDRIPVDGRVRAGSSRVDESTLTGESIPAAKGEGSEVFAGTLNSEGSLDVVVTRTADDTALARVVRLVEEARDAQAPTQGWIERTEGRYAVGVIVATALAVAIPWLGLGWSFADAFYRGMTLLVVASPCALVISIPATIVSAVANGARRGVLFKGGAHLDALAGVRAVAFDKTGTLTVGRPELIGIAPVAGLDAFEDADGLLSLVAAVEARSEHPLGAAVLGAAATRGLDVSAAEDFDSAAGRGIEGRVRGVHLHVGRRSWVESFTGSPPPEALALWVDGAVARAATPVWVSVDGAWAGALAIADRPRDGAGAALESLRAAGIDHVVMLTGDDARTARAVADALGIDEVHAELLPEDKQRVLSGLRQAHGPVAMVGDGVNDAPALASAEVGIALGAAGTEVAMETADVVVMGEDLNSLAHAVRLGHRARRVVLQNLVFSVAVMTALVVLALGGWIDLTVGVLGHEGSTVVVVFNGLRLLRNGG
jgi:Cd2+/Zn2+-exporting ATPase